MREFTGKHMLLITLSFFGVIIAVNLFMAYKSHQTFPGIEVNNSYVASQNFNERRNAQLALGWTLSAHYENGQMNLSFTDAAGAPVEVDDLKVLIGRTTRDADDVEPEMIWTMGSYTAAVPLEKGQWMVKVWANAKDGTPYEQRIDFYVRG